MYEKRRVPGFSAEAHLNWSENSTCGIMHRDPRTKNDGKGIKNLTYILYDAAVPVTAGTLRHRTPAVAAQAGTKHESYADTAQKGKLMFLSDTEIREMIENGRLEISPFSQSQIQSASIDLTLGNVFSKITTGQNEIILPNRPPKYKMIPTNMYLLDPGEFILATTQEYLRLPDDVIAFIEGRSSYGRLGLFVQNAGWIDPGFEGELTLQLYNANKASIAVEAGMRLGKIVFAKTGKPAAHPYNGKYQGQKGVTGSMAYKDYQ